MVDWWWYFSILGKGGVDILKLVNKIYFLKDVSIYTLASIINAAIPFLLMPVLTRYLSPTDYGIIAIAQSIIGFLTPFIGLNLQGAISKEYYGRKIVNISQYIMSCLQILFISGILIFIISLLNADNIEKIIGFPKNYLGIIVLITIFQNLGSYGLSFLQISKKSKKYGIIQILITIVNTVISVVFVVGFAMNWQGRILAQFIAASIFMYIGISIFKKENVLRYTNMVNYSYIKDALFFGVPLLPHALSGFFIMLVDRMYIANMFGNSIAGLYVAGSQIGMVLNILTAAINQAYVPWLFEKLKNPTWEVKTKIVKYTYLYMFGLLIAATIFSALAPMIVRIFLSDNFIDSQDYVWGSLFSGAFTGMYYMVVNYIFYTGKTGFLSLTTLGMGIFHIVTAYLLIKSAGAIGAVYASVITGVVTFLLVWYLSDKVYDMPWLKVFTREGHDTN